MVDRMIGGRSFKGIVGYKNVDELLKRIAPWSFSVRKSDCLDLPPIVREIRDIEMSPEMTRIYKALAQDLVATLKDADGEGRVIIADNVLTKLLRCQQLLGGTAVDSNGQKIVVPENKTKEILEVLDEIGDRKVKVLIWARFVDEITRLTEVLNKAGYRAEAVYGAVKVADRQGIIDRFNEGNVEVIVAQQQTIGFGVNITGASVVIYYSNDWSLANRQQSESRAHRHGNVNEKITIIDLISKGTLETAIVKALESKKRFQDLFFDSKDTAKKIMEGGE
jgi:SNF2 family DNA or RNA helicase